MLKKKKKEIAQHENASEWPFLGSQGRDAAPPSPAQVCHLTP